MSRSGQFYRDPTERNKDTNILENDIYRISEALEIYRDRLHCWDN